MAKPLNLPAETIDAVRAALLTDEPLREIAKRLGIGRHTVDQQSLLMRREKRVEVASPERCAAGDLPLPAGHMLSMAGLPVLTCLQVSA